MTTSPPGVRARLVWIGVLPPHQGGAAVSAHQLLLGLAGAGYDIRTIAPVTVDAGDAAQSFDTAHRVLNVSRFVVPYAETNPNIPAPDAYRESEQAQVETALSALIQTQRPDAILLGRETFAWRAPSIAERHDVPCILRIAGGFLAGVIGGTYPRELVSRWIEQARKADVIVAQTESVVASLTALGLSRIRIIPNGVDLGLFAPAPKEDTLLRQLGIDDARIVVMHVSNLKPLKRAMDLVTSAAVAVRENPRLIYVVVGDGPDRAAMEAACRRSEIIDHFRFVGWVPYDRVPAYLNLADIVVMPSEREAQARVYLETQACGRVLLASDIAAARHVVSDGDTGLLFRRGDIADLTRRTLDAAADRAVRARIGARARQRVAAHALDEVARAYGDTIDDVIAGRRIAVPAATETPGDDCAARRAAARAR